MTNVSMDEIKKLVGLQLGAREVEADSLLVEDLSAESADVANIVAVLEEKYQICGERDGDGETTHTSRPV
jgi:acyl carrier protein